MTTSTVAQNNTTGKTAEPRGPVWQTLLFVGLILALFAIALWLRLHDLGVQFDRDSYDEGVYWQTLRSMSEGYTLYQQIFYSQPPIFMFATFPIYTLFGQTIWAARLAMVLLSLLGLLGAVLLGYALRGRIGATAALLLLVANPLYLAQSQTLQAEAPCVALEFLAVGLAYLWWQQPEGRKGLCLAALSTIALVLSIMSKLFGFAALVPIGLLALARLWQILRQPADQQNKRWSAAVSLLAGIAALIITTIAVLLPFVGSLPQLIQQVISFHVAAGHALKAEQTGNLATIRGGLTSLLALAALYGTIVALLRRDWHVIPLLGWLFATLYLLWGEIPLFQHHLVIMVPPLISLAIMGITPFSLKQPQVARVWQVTTIVALLLIVVVSGLNLRDSRSYLRTEHGHNMAVTNNSPQQQVIKDLQTYTQPDQLVITDGQFIMALAGRSTTPDLVDTSSVHIQSGYLTAQQLITDAAQPQVHAILFYTGRLRRPELASFDDWVTTHYRLVRNYGNGNGLWVKIT